MNNQPQYNQSKQHANKNNEKLKKDKRKWCETHKMIPWNNNDDCHAKQPLFFNLKAYNFDLSQHQ